MIVPVHDEERSVALLHDELAAALDPLGEPWEVVFVDDGSTDGTFAALTRLHAAHDDIRVVRLRRNFGKAAALQAGFEEARGEIVVTIDGDLQDDPSEIPRLLAKLDEGFDLVSGWKTKRRDPLSRRIPSRIFNAVTGRLSGLRLHDLNCGLKAYRAEVVHGLRIYGELHRFIPVLAHYRGFRVAELPVNHRPREHGRSRYGMERYVRGFLDLLTVTFMGRYRHRPLHLFGGLGLLLGALGTLVLGYLTVLKLTGEAIGHRPLLTLGVLLVVVGVQLVSLGLVSELVASHHEERSRRTEHRSCTWTRSSADLRILYFGTYERGYPRNAQVISCLRGAGAEVIERHASVWERRRHNWSVGLGAAARVGLAETRLLRGAAESASTRSSSATRGTSTCLQPGGSRAAAPSSSTRSSRCTRRSSRTAAASRRPRPPPRVLRWIDRIALRRADLVVADTAQNARAPRRARRAARRAARGLLRRRGGAAVPAGMAAGGDLPRALRRQADPAARARDDPGGGASRARDPVSCRRQRPARRAPARAAAERRVGRMGRLRAPAGREPAGAAARSASSAPPRRRRA